jgi:hypothetical protein
MLDLAIVLAATTMALLVVSIRSFGRALESRRIESAPIRRKPLSLKARPVTAALFSARKAFSSLGAR